jgi:hypothetical protein
MSYGTWTIHVECGHKSQHTDTDRAAGLWEPGRGMGWRPNDPSKRVRFCSKNQGHPDGVHEYVGDWLTNLRKEEEDA